MSLFSQPWGFCHGLTEIEQQSLTFSNEARAQLRNAAYTQVCEYRNKRATKLQNEKRQVYSQHPIQYQTVYSVAMSDQNLNSSKTKKDYSLRQSYKNERIKQSRMQFENATLFFTSYCPGCTG